MDWRYNTIWFEQIESGKFLNCDLKVQKLPTLDITNIEYAIFWHYKHKGLSFDTFPQSDKLLYLELNWANIKDFMGIEKLSALKRLEVHYCTKIEIDNGLSLLSDTIEYLHINQSKKLQSIDEICKLSNLKVLCLNNCGPLENLQFLKAFPKLVDFRFVDTNILDGDLTPLIEHPTIRSVGFLNKRHYNYRDEEIDSALELKSNEAYEDFAYKGEYETSKYKGYDQD